METQNKKISVHMTHFEYEQYKKYLDLMNESKQILFFENHAIGADKFSYYTKVYSLDETIKIYNESLELQIKKLREDNQYLKEAKLDEWRLRLKIERELNELKEKYCIKDNEESIKKRKTLKDYWFEFITKIFFT